MRVQCIEDFGVRLQRHEYCLRRRDAARARETVREGYLGRGRRVRGGDLVFRCDFICILPIF